MDGWQWVVTGAILVTYGAYLYARARFIRFCQRRIEQWSRDNRLVILRLDRHGPGVLTPHLLGGDQWRARLEDRAGRRVRVRFTFGRLGWAALRGKMTVHWD